MLIEASGNVREISDLLGSADPGTVCEHLKAVRRQLDRPVDQYRRRQVAGIVLARNGVPPDGLPLYEGIIDDIAKLWSWSDLDQLLAEIRTVNPRYAHNVGQWLERRGRPNRRERARQKKAAGQAGRSGGWLRSALGLGDRPGDGRAPGPDPIPPVPPTDR